MPPERSIGLVLGRAFALAGAVVFVSALGLGWFTYVFSFGVDTHGPATGAPTPSPIPAASFDALLFSVFALHHSLFARTGIKNAVTAVVTPRFERTFYVWLSSLLFAWVLLAWKPVPGTLWSLGNPWRWVLVAAQLLGVLITARASGALDVFSLAGLRQAFDRPGAPTLELKESGWYGIVRHPIYLGWVLMVWPTPLMTGSRLAFAAISTFYLALAVPFEERSLTAQFGPRYTAYASRVRYRMVPFLY
jgi:hypothetical protein